MNTVKALKDLSYGVNKANNWRADLFISIHFNKGISDNRHISFYLLI